MAEVLRTLSRRWFEEVWNQGREATIAELMKLDAVAHGLAQGQRDLRGAAGFAEFYRPFRTAFPDIRVNVDDVIRDGNKTVSRLTFTGTHTGDGLGIPPTGRQFTSTAIVFMRWENEQIAEAWNEFDAAGMMAQLTAPPPVALRPA